MKKVREGYKMTELGEIPSDWEVKTIDDICYLNPDTLSNKTEEKFIIEYIDIESVTTGKINGTKMLEFKNSPSRARRIVKKNDVIMSTVRPYLKAFTKVNIDKENLVCSTGFAVLRAKDDINDEFIFQTILSDYYIQQLSNKMVGSNYPAVNTSDIKESIIILPSKKEQEKMALILSTVDEQIDNVEGLIQKNKELKKGLMQQLLTKGIGHTKFKKTDIGEIPEAWEFRNLRLLINNNRNISYGVLKPGDYTENGVPMIRILDIKDNRLNMDEVYKITNELDEQYKKTRLEGNEILISLVGTIGRIAYTENKHKGMNVHRNIGVIPIDKEKASKYYVFYTLATSFMQKAIAKKTIGGNQPLLNLEDVRELEIICPQIEEQEKIASILSEVDEKIDKYEKKKQKLEELKKGLMQQLLTGKIRVI